MNKTTLNVYILIMLECRLSLSDAASIFKMDEKELESELNHYYLIDNHMENAIKYLIYYEVYYINKKNDRGLFKARLLLNQYLRILKIEDKSQRSKMFKDYITMLKGPNINFLKDKDPDRKYTEQEKNAILKYRLKYALGYRAFDISYKLIKSWEKNLEDEDLRMQIKCLNEYNEIKCQHDRASLQNKSVK